MGISDRLDTLVSIFGLGLIPSGSSDPFALRRATNAIINITWHSGLSLNVLELIEQGATDFLQAHPEYCIASRCAQALFPSANSDVTHR